MSVLSRYQQLAEDACAAGWTSAQVLATLRARIDHDDRYGSRRRRQQRYDEQVMTDLYAFALAIAGAHTTIIDPRI